MRSPHAISRFLHSITRAACLAVSVLSFVAPAAADPTFLGIGALPAPFEYSGRYTIHTRDGVGLVGGACTSDNFTAPCKPFRVIPHGTNSELSLLSGDASGSAWAITPDRRVVVGFSQNAPSSHRGRTAVRWIDGGPPLPLASHSESIHTWARGVSADGAVISGHRIVSFDETAFVWTESLGMFELLDSTLPLLDQSEWIGQADDDQVVAMLHRGNTPGSNGPTRAIRWTQAGGLELLGPIPNGFTSTSAAAVAGETGDIVGTLWTGDQGTSDAIGYRWSNAAMLDLFMPPASHLDAHALRISRDGSTTLGYFADPVAGGLETEAFRWTSTEGVVSLGPAPGFDRTTPLGLSDDGSAIWAAMDSSVVELVFDAMNAPDVYENRTERRSFIWTASSGRVDLPHALPLLSNCDHDFWTQVEDVAADGSVAFGRASCDAADSYFEYLDPFQGWIVDRFQGATQEVAFAWDSVSGFQTLNAYLAARYGVDLSGWEIESASIDDVGEGILYGSGRHNGKSEGWVLTVPEPGSAMMIASGALWLGLLVSRTRRVDP